MHMDTTWHIPFTTATSGTLDLGSVRTLDHMKTKMSYKLENKKKFHI